MKKITLLILSIIFIGCTINSYNQYAYLQPANIDDDLRVGTLSEAKIDSTLIIKAVNDINKGKFKEIHSMLIYKDNKLVFEEYFSGHKHKWNAHKHHGKLENWDKSMPHKVMSVSKSVTSICIGIAIDKGFIESVQQSIFDYLPEHQHFKKNGKDEITIEHLLTMTSGLKWDEWSSPLSSKNNDIISLWFRYKDPIKGILKRPLLTKPGTHFTYSGGNTIILGEILKNATKMSIDEFSTKYLFEPLDINNSNWAVKYRNGTIQTAGSLEITPRAMTKIGATFLNNGVWNNKQIISQEWIEKSKIPYRENKNLKIPKVDSGKVGYAYSWWTGQGANGKTSIFYAGGWGGQYIMVIPDWDMVVTFTGGNYLDKVRVFEILTDYILPAVN
ncbi:MAG: serine hydrolase [Candidatus Cloacimonetes bacterium]|jgi:CubicO group peptidase (beta-lactamase class C family)|nr:serine hydrolase [Candidatus Cloacimonadota bacterium]MBT6994726.1 serine hydrolase [Candidatus Cloacimonadota bacterium]MBT7469184.1 serine hydrolase [Candidatus Cloacimonadota bacterium]